jgi:SNF2 family DNA or RNA helicase
MKLFQWQEDCLAKLIDNELPHAILADPGTGKTLVAMMLARNTNKHLIVVAPNRVHTQWKTEAKKFFNDDSFVTSFYYEQIRTDKGKAELKSTLVNNDCLLVLDESHRIKNHKTKTYKVCKAAGKLAKRKLILTGSPVANSPSDLWSQIAFLVGEQGIESYNEFCDKYIEFLPPNHPLVRSLPGRPKIAARSKDGKVITKNLADLKERLAKWSTQVKSSECRDLPDVTQITIDCKLGSELRKAYDDLEDTFMLELKDGNLLTVENVVSLLTRLSMLTSGIPSAEAGAMYDHPKIKALLEILNIHEGVPSIVWTRWKDEYNTVVKALDDKGVKWTSDPALFQEGLGDVFLSSPAKGGTGLNLTRAKMQIWVSRSWSIIERTQALARNDRAGQDANHLHVYELVAKNTIDEKIIRALNDKEDLLNSILTKNKL